MRKSKIDFHITYFSNTTANPMSSFTRCSVCDCLVGPAAITCINGHERAIYAPTTTTTTSIRTKEVHIHHFHQVQVSPSPPVFPVFGIVVKGRSNPGDWILVENGEEVGVVRSNSKMYIGDATNGGDVCGARTTKGTPCQNHPPTGYKRCNEHAYKHAMY